MRGKRNRLIGNDGIIPVLEGPAKYRAASRRSVADTHPGVQVVVKFGIGERHARNRRSV